MRETFERIAVNAETIPRGCGMETTRIFKIRNFRNMPPHFGGCGHTQELSGNEALMEIAAAHNKTPAQVILRWQA